MYAVIFSARIARLDAEYSEMAEAMRALAMEKYGCRKFSSVTDGDSEVAISYWDDEQQIRDWKQDPKHLLAQQAGRRRWYESYTVEVVEIVRRYTSADSDTPKQVEP